MSSSRESGHRSEALKSSTYEPGHVLASRQKGPVTWQARISTDRGRLEVVGLVPPSATATTIEVLTEPELRDLLGFAGARRARPTPRVPVHVHVLGGPDA